MALDRFVRWRDDRPNLSQVERVLQNFFGGAAEIRWGTDRFFVTLPGVRTFPFNGLGNPREASEAERSAEDPVRMIEVWMDHNCLDILTRQQDEYTNSLAHGLAQMFARYWQGEVEV